MKKYYISAMIATSEALTLIIFLFLFIAKPVYPQGNPFIYMDGDKFMYRCEEIYPMVVNYGVIIIQDKYDQFHISPDLSTCHTCGGPNWFSCGIGYIEWHEEIKNHMIKADSMGFNMVRLMALGVQYNTEYDTTTTDNLYTRKYFEQSHHPDSLEALYNNGKRITINDTTYELMGNLIEEFINIIKENDLSLKLIFNIGGSGVEEDTENYLPYLAYIANRFKDEPVIFTYDLYNEPGYFTRYYKNDKYLRANTVAQWYNIIKQNAPSQYITIGHIKSDVFDWDPTVLNQDFISYHQYPMWFEPDTFNAVNGFKRYKPIIKWLSETTDKPWIIGETGFPGVDSVTPLHPIIGTEAEQAWFADSSLLYTHWYGAKGYSWWIYKDVKWGYHTLFKSKEHFFGLVRRFSDTQEHKPAAEEILN